MVATIPFNPFTTTVGQGLFNLDSHGARQGTAYPDPAIRYKLASGTLAYTETLPMWGGVGIYTDVPGAAGTPNASLGTVVGRATSLANLIAFSVFDQDYSMVNSPASPVPLAASGMSVNYYRLGSGARVWVKCDPNLVDLRGGLTTADVSWDFVNQQLTAYASATLTSGPFAYPTAATISSGTYNATTGAVSLTTNAAHGLGVGYTFSLSGMTGTGEIADLDGTFTSTAGTTGSTLNFTVPIGLTLTITGGTLGDVGVSLTTTAPHGLLPGDSFVLSGLTGTGAAQLDGEWIAQPGTTGSTLTFSATAGLTITSITGGGASTGGILPVQVLDVVATNCMTVDYAPPNATWNFNDCAALILI